ncbi:MAG: ribose 5-phosphate isomerase B [Cyclobacteriaceae bacterium]|jgi:ribose 5-phosphate isomerase B|nr:ribose 5-phosphate isomerase B [Flammeovirgaceae bacterium]
MNDVKPTVALGADHAGYALKEVLRKKLEQYGYHLRDFGTNNGDSVDYPDFARPVAVAVEKGEFDLGLLICGSANGVAMTANKRPGIRAAICWTEELGALAREHNNANVLCLPARFIDEALAEKILIKFLTTSFEGGRHQRRVDKIAY